MSPIALLLLLSTAVMVVLFGWSLVVQFRRYDPKKKAKQALKKAPLVAISEAREGQLVKIVGRVVRAEEPFTVPLSGHACACYEVRVYLSDGDFDRHDEARGVDFVIADETGRARVDCRSLEALVLDEGSYKEETLGALTPEIEAFFTRHGRIGTLMSGQTIKYREWTVVEGQEIAVVGQVSMEADPEPAAGGRDYRSAPQRVVIGASTDGFVIVTDNRGP